MNDDWDGVDWADYFSGPDDSEIEAAQEFAYRASCADDRDADSIGADDTGDDVGEACQRPVEVKANHLRTEIALVAFSFQFDSNEDANAFCTYACKNGARNVSVSTKEVAGSLTYTVNFLALPGVNFFYYRTGSRYSETERQLIIRSYLCWQDIEQIAERHRRTPSAISSLLQKAGIVNYDMTSSQISDEVGWIIEISDHCLQSGRYPWELATFLKFADRSNSVINDLPYKDKKKFIAFAASFISLDYAKRLARALNQWSLLYFLALQSRDVITGLEALNHKRFVAGSESLIFEIRCYLRFQAFEVIRPSLIKWIERPDVRYNSVHEMHTSFLEALLAFKRHYDVASPTRGFCDQGIVRLVAALLSCDFEATKCLAASGDELAKWYCCEWVVFSINSGGNYRCDPDWARQADLLSINDSDLVNDLQSALSFDLNTALSFKRRIESR
jgi:hypothetical protein